MRQAFIEQNPVCVECLKDGVANAEELEVDHVRPFKGPDDPLRLDWGNLQTLCKSHHVRKTQGTARNESER